MSSVTTLPLIMHWESVPTGGSFWKSGEPPHAERIVARRAIDVMLASFIVRCFPLLLVVVNKVSPEPRRIRKWKPATECIDCGQAYSIIPSSLH